jgi:hypothetical protein
MALLRDVSVIIEVINEAVLEHLHERRYLARRD